MNELKICMRVQLTSINTVTLKQCCYGSVLQYMYSSQFSKFCRMKTFVSWQLMTMIFSQLTSQAYLHRNFICHKKRLVCIIKGKKPANRHVAVTTVYLLYWSLFTRDVLICKGLSGFAEYFRRYTWFSDNPKCCITHIQWQHSTKSMIKVVMISNHCHIPPPE